MHDAPHNPHPNPDDLPLVLPVRPASPPPPPPAPPRSSGGWLRILLVLLLFGSLGVNLVLLLFVAGLSISTAEGSDGLGGVSEKYLGGSSSATNKVAVVRVEGMIMEGMLGFVHKEIDKAAKDDKVKAVVLRVESPGGTITASDDLHRRLVELRDGTNPRVKSAGKKPLVVSMGALAASGGYYISMPAETLVAERTTLTGSIGVYASFYNAAELGKKWGIRSELIKAGDIKGAGGLFAEMTPQERQPWQDMVNHAYKQFIGIVEEGRPKLKGKLTENLFPPKPIPLYDDKGNVEKGGKPGDPPMYTRKRADGGIFTAEDAKAYGLIDEIGYLERAAELAYEKTNLGGEYKIVGYEKPISLLGALSASAEAKTPELAKLANGAVPRLWYMLPQAEAAGVLAASGRE